MSPDEIARALAVAAEAPAPPPGERQAAVAVLLRFDRDGAEALLVRRAERAGDRWSGHVGLPGGHADALDADLYATALRETREEVGIDLARAARLLGRLASLEARPREPFRPLCIHPFVFAARETAEPSLGPEVVEAFWFPLERARTGALAAAHSITRDGVRITRPSWSFEGRVVWGLTYEILSSLLRAAAQ